MNVTGSSSSSSSMSVIYKDPAGKKLKSLLKLKTSMKGKSFQIYGLYQPS